MQTELFTFGGATGAGVFRASFTIDGTLFTQGRTEHVVVFSHAINGRPTLTTFRIQDARGSLTLYTPTGYVGALPGLAVSGNNAVGQQVTGSGTRYLAAEGARAGLGRADAGRRAGLGLAAASSPGPHAATERGRPA